MKWAGWRQADQFCAATTLETRGEVNEKDAALAKHANEIVFCRD